MDIPKLYETEGISLDDKMIYQKWEIPQIGFYWLIAEVDLEKDLAFGYANLNDDQMAEWGYIPIDELKENGASLIEDWIPMRYGEIER